MFPPTRTLARKEVVPSDGDDVIPFSECVLIQSTGLFDKDDKEIFDGSILELENGKIMYVYYCNEFAEFVITGLGKVDYEDPVFAISSHAKVVGHVLSNPELLEEK